MQKIVFAAVVAVSLSSCAGKRLTNKEKIVSAVLGATAIGFAYGHARESSQKQNGVLYGSAFAATSALAGIYIFDEEDRSEKFRKETIRLQTELDELKRQMTPARESFSRFQVSRTDEIPNELKGLIQPGSMRVYEINRWEEDGENRLVFKTKAVEFEPPSLIK